MVMTYYDMFQRSRQKKWSRAREGFGHPVPRQRAHFLHPGCTRCLLTTGLFPLSVSILIPPTSVGHFEHQSDVFVLFFVRTSLLTVLYFLVFSLLRASSSSFRSLFDLFSIHFRSLLSFLFSADHKKRDWPRCKNRDHVHAYTA